MILVPYFIKNFGDIRQEKEREENYQKELAQKRAEEKAKKGREG